jgi:nucleotide-binding universal stress UspA family protein
LASTTRQTNPSRRVPASKTRSTGEAVEPDAAPSQYSGVKQIIACVDGTEADRTVLDHALAVALRFGSHIDVLHVRFDVHGVSVGAGRERYGDRLLDVPVEHAVADAAARARRHFEAWQARCKLPARDTGVAMRGPSASWREILGYESDVIARLGRLSDLIVIARPGERSSSSSLMALETALFDTGRPVLMVPDRTEAANLFRRPLIAWNGSLEAARAVGFALPFLCECEGGADVFVAPEQKHRTDTEELLRYLGWHGIVAERMSVESSGPIGMSLLAQASTNRAGLIVMGAYTHGHYRQFFFGGVTRYVMEHAAVPVLLAH